MKIVVLGGGESTEREVSLRSAKAVSDALETAGFDVINLDPINFAVLDSIDSKDIVFPILHGNNGEDGKIQRELESRGLAFLGSGSKSSEICFDKTRARDAFQAAGLPIADGGAVTKESYRNHPLIKKPHVLKISEGGSSIGTYLVHDPNLINTQKVSEVFSLGEHAVIEELVDGVEITVPLLDGQALPVIEIKPPENEEFDYANKYNGKTQEICPPTAIDKTIQEHAQRLSEKAYAALGCRHLARADIIVRSDNNMVILEINTMPGMTSQSLYPLSANVAGLTFPELMKQFVKLVERDYAV